MSCISNTSEISHSCILYCMHSLSPMISLTPTSDINATVNASLVACIQFLEAQNTQPHKTSWTGKAQFRVEHTACNESPILLYTGFPLYEVYISFFEFLGPVVHHLRYHGS